jgi:hypothetical protein
MPRPRQTSRNLLKRKRNENDTTTSQISKKPATSPFLREDVDEKQNATSNIRKNAGRLSKMEDVDEAIGHMDSSLLADHFAKQ